MNEPMACRAFVDLVTEYLDDVMPQAERARFEQHLQECPHCRRYLAQIRMTISLSGRLHPGALQSGTREELLACFREWHTAGTA